MPCLWSAPGPCCSKCKGHARRSEAQTGTHAGLDKCGNDAADELAKEGRRLHEVLATSSSVGQAVVAVRATARQALQWAAEAHVFLEKGRKAALKGQESAWHDVNLASLFADLVDLCGGSG